MNWKRLSPSHGHHEPTPGGSPTLILFDQATATRNSFPSTIDRIYHVKLIREHLGDPPDPRPRCGCRQGRLRHVFPCARTPRLWGYDLCREMLDYVPAGIHTRTGGRRPDFPFPTPTFRSRLCHRGLEHAVENGKRQSRMLPPSFIPRRTHRHHRSETPSSGDGSTRRNRRNRSRPSSWSTCSAATLHVDSRSFPLGSIEPDGLCTWLAPK